MPRSMVKRRRLSTSEVAVALGVNFSPSAIVLLDEVALRRIADHVLRKRHEFSALARSKWDDPLFWNVADTPERRSQYLAVGNAMNFRFWRWAGDKVEPAGGRRQGRQFFGAMYLWRSLRCCLEEGMYPILDATFLATMSAVQFDEIFSDDTGYNPLAIAAPDRLANLRDLGLKLEAKWAGQFYNLVRAASDSLVRFVELSRAFRAFDDPNFKLTMVNAILHSGSGITEFDAEPLPGIDYHLLKQVLRHGILRPIGDLSRKIEKREFLDRDEGQELRRMALCAFVRLSKLTGIGGEIIDNKWWANRSKCKDRDPVCLDGETAHECPFYGACEQRVELQFPLEETRYY